MVRGAMEEEQKIKLGILISATDHIRMQIVHILSASQL